MGTIEAAIDDADDGDDVVVDQGAYTGGGGQERRPWWSGDDCSAGVRAGHHAGGIMLGSSEALADACLLIGNHCDNSSADGGGMLLAGDPAGKPVSKKTVRGERQLRIDTVLAVFSGPEWGASVRRRPIVFAPAGRKKRQRICGTPWGVSRILIAVEVPLRKMQVAGRKTHFSQVFIRYEGRRMWYNNINISLMAYAERSRR